MNANRHRARFWIGTVMLLAVVSTPGEAQRAGRDPVLGQPMPGTTTVIDRDHPVTASGTLRLWRVASSQGARVMLKVYRPDSDRLLLVGTSPLETVPAGGVATFSCSIPVARNDLVGCFCPDSSCVDAFADGETWSVEGDVGTGPLASFTPGVGAPAIFAAGSLLADVPSGSATDLVVPVVARTPGLNSTVWSTRLELMNTSDRAADVALLFNLTGVNNTTPAASAQATIEPQGTIVFEDLMLEAFELAEAAGSVDIVSTERLLGHARIANYGGAAGSYGQSVPAVPAAWALAEDDVPGTDPAAGTAVLFRCREDADFRSNLGVTSVASVPLTVEVTALVDSAVVGTPLVLELEPFSHTQVNRVLQQMGVAAGVSGVRLEVAAAAGSRGRFLAYMSQVDNLSGDAVFLLGDHTPALP